MEMHSTLLRFGVISVSTCVPVERTAIDLDVNQARSLSLGVPSAFLRLRSVSIGDSIYYNQTQQETLPPPNPQRSASLPSTLVFL
jgi:hypothetical protein